MITHLSKKGYRSSFYKRGVTTMPPISSRKKLYLTIICFFFVFYLILQKFSVITTLQNKQLGADTFEFGGLIVIEIGILLLILFLSDKEEQEVTNNLTEEASENHADQPNLTLK